MLHRTTTACTIIISFIFFVSCTSVTKLGDNRAKKSNRYQDRVTQFPFTMLSGGVIIIKASLENFEDSLNFILDTGSGGISLDTTTVASLQLKAEPSDRMLRGIGSLRKVSYVRNKILHLPGLDLPHLDFHINDYDLLTSAYGEKIDGIIGYSLFSKYVVKINYDTQMIEVWNFGSVTYPKKGMLVKTNITGIPVFTATVGDDRLHTSRFFFDTGAGLYLLMSEKFEKDSAIINKSKRRIETQAEGLGGKQPMVLSTVKHINIGKYKFKKVPAHIFHDTYNVTSYPHLGGLIGNDLLRKFNLVVNYEKNEIHLLPNSHFKEAFDYSYTGLGIYWVNGFVIIEDVMPNSPAFAAGLEPGDIIVAIDNKINGSIQTYKSLLQVVGARYRIVVNRGGELVVKKLKVGSIL